MVIALTFLINDKLGINSIILYIYTINLSNAFIKVNNNKQKVAEIMGVMRAICQDFFSSEYGQDFHDSEKFKSLYSPEDTVPRHLVSVDI